MLDINENNGVEMTGQDNGLSPENGQSVSAGSVWTFLTNHSHVLVCLAEDPHLRLRDVAERVGITERAVQRIVTDLEDAGILTRLRDGRRNHYQIHACCPLRHPVEAHRTIQDLLDFFHR